MGIGSAAVVARAISRLRQIHSSGKMRRRFVELGNGKNEKMSITRDVPKGHCAVYAGHNRRRFVIPTWLLSHPILVSLLQKSADEFGFDHDLNVHYIVEMICKKQFIRYSASKIDLDGVS